MSRISLLAGLVLATAPVSAFAGMDYLSYSTSLTQFDASGTKILLPNLALAGEYSINDFVLSGTLGGLKATADGIDGALDLYTGSLLVGYQAFEGFTVFGGYALTSAEGIDDSSYALGSEYTTGAFSFGGIYDYYDADTYTTSLFGAYDGGAITVGAGVVMNGDSNDYVLALDYDAGVFALDSSTLYNDESEFVLSTLSGTLEIGNKFRLLGDVFYATDSVDTAYIATLGAGYRFNSNAWVDLSAGKIYADDTALADVLELKLSVETGKRALKSQAFRDDYADALPAFIAALF